MTFIVLCRASVHEGGDGHFEQATRRTFADMASAQEYAAGISQSREPTVVRLGPAPTCQDCKHWKRANDKGWDGQHTGIPIGDQSYSDDGPGPRTEHGHCQVIQHTHIRSWQRRSSGRIDPDSVKLTRREDSTLSIAQAVVCDSEEYSAWLCTLPTFGCALFEERSDG
jgi:hypothetical protein